jgi:hypothetical protein
MASAAGEGKSISSHIFKLLINHIRFGVKIVNQLYGLIQRVSYDVLKLAQSLLIKMNKRCKSGLEAAG